MVAVAVIPAKAGIQFFSGFRVGFHLPGMTILLPELSNSGSPPAEPGVYLSDKLKGIRIPPGIQIDGELFDPPLKASEIEEIRIH